MLRAIAKENGWKKPWEASPYDSLVLIAKVKGTDSALKRYDALKKSWPGNEQDREGTLNGLGYTLLRSGQVQDTIAVFRRNVQEFPKSSNVYDSLAEAYAKAGQKSLAIENYQKALELDPKNGNAAEQLKKLK
jgi:Tfp pilus assembly protein PilF